MGLSVIVIGRNSERTIPECISSLCSFAKQYPEINIELLYVDSASSDSSVEVVKRALIGSIISFKIISIESINQSAALGRCIGMQIASYSDILFVDSDMVVDLVWLAQALARRDYRILSGQRYEVYFDNNTCWIADKRYYKTNDLGRVSRPGGLFLLFDADKTTARFTPFLRSEEEADFVAQDPQLNDSIYRTSEVAFVHLNRKPTTILKRLYGNLRGMPAMSNYICGRINAINRGFYIHVLKSSYFYEIGAVCSLMFYCGLLLSNWFLIAGAAMLVASSKRKMSILYRCMVFPLELILGVGHYVFNRSKYNISYSVVYSSVKAIKA